MQNIQYLKVLFFHPHPSIVAWARERTNFGLDSQSCNDWGDGFVWPLNHPQSWQAASAYRRVCGSCTTHCGNSFSSVQQNPKSWVLSSASLRLHGTRSREVVSVVEFMIELLTQLQTSMIRSELMSKAKVVSVTSVLEAAKVQSLGEIVTGSDMAQLGCHNA